MPCLRNMVFSGRRVVKGNKMKRVLVQASYWWSIRFVGRQHAGVSFADPFR